MHIYIKVKVTHLGHPQRPLDFLSSLHFLLLNMHKKYVADATDRFCSSINYIMELYADWRQNKNANHLNFNILVDLDR